MPLSMGWAVLCLLFSNTERLTWERASVDCQEAGSSLVSNLNQGQLDFVRSQLLFLADIGVVDNWWTSGTDFGREDQKWIWMPKLTVDGAGSWVLLTNVSISAKRNKVVQLLASEFTFNAPSCCSPVRILGMYLIFISKSKYAAQPFECGQCRIWWGHSLWQSRCWTKFATTTSPVGMGFEHCHSHKRSNLLSLKVDFLNQNLFSF